ncbi:MAG: VOC family protein [Cyclobacteriaceae bacterium]|nr:VOC family protein [Cyclobacteriaceae bacterium]
MDIDHIFIFTEDQGRIAEELVKFGLIEGSSRVHTGQGTTNRKFYFDNFFLEILWVHNENEIKSSLIEPTGLCQRADYKKNGLSPYGLCIVNSEQTDALFGNSMKYQPDYFPGGMLIEILKNENQPHLPWTFRLSFRGQKKNESEPKNHTNGIRSLTKVTFNHKPIETEEFLHYFKGQPNIVFSTSNDYGLTLTFDNNQQQKKRIFEDLRLTIEY